MKLIIIIALLLIFSGITRAEYNDNITRKVTDVLTYTDADYIYFKIENPPEHPVCNNNFFVISGSIPVERRQMLLSRLLVAYTTQETVSIGYDNSGNCLGGYIRAHRVG